MAQDHFLRHNHDDNSLDWNFNVVFGSNPEVSAMAEAYKPILIRPELYDPIPTEWLHATILRVGEVKEYSEDEMSAVAKLAQTRVESIQLPEFHFGNHVLIHGNICFAIEPAGALEQLYDIVTESLEEIVGPDRATKSPYGKFIAHMSLAYTRAQDNEADIDEMLRNANIPSAHFKIHSMPLIKQHPTSGHYEWEIVTDIQIP